ncbi:LysR substrate-binding domain-containing protein [Ralstonia sp. UBA689]|uniref:LysR substrate-binding domain-containing protein n=1 Tax=Ralstonia sp. UBA689 TaxID=1947373 RepID=UPI0025E576B7|nr:LysR substrate-binding domain-containing protein [Ralstonia sp. UBA689]
MPESPDALREHRCIRYRFPSSGALHAWEFAEPGQGGVMQAVGLARVLEDLVAEDLAAGRLVRVLDVWCPPMYRFHLYFPRTPQMPGKLRTFIDFLRARLGGSASA